MSCENFDFDITSTAADAEKISAIAAHYKAILELVGENPNREGLLKTPMRAAKALWFATEGYRQQPQDILNQAIFEYCGSKMIIVRDIEFYSFCEHHILPFYGTVSVAYIPKGCMIGLSKLPRLVNAVARKLQVQERLTAEICKEIQTALRPEGVMAVCTARHLCMEMRGVEKQLSSTRTTDYTGVFATDPVLRNEFLAMLK